MFEDQIQRIVESIRRQMASRCWRSAVKLKNASLEVLNGSRGGRTYKIPAENRYYTASAPGEPPAVRFDKFRVSWEPSPHCSGDSYISRIESNLNVNGYNLGSLLENGTSKMAPRPHQEKIFERARPEIERIYQEPYF